MAQGRDSHSLPLPRKARQGEGEYQMIGVSRPRTGLREQPMPEMEAYEIRGRRPVPEPGGRIKYHRKAAMPELHDGSMNMLLIVNTTGQVRELRWAARIVQTRGTSCHTRQNRKAAAGAPR